MVQLPNENEDKVTEEWTFSKAKSEFGLPLLDTDQQTIVHSLIFNFCKVLQSNSQHITSAHVTEHHIDLYRRTPIYQKPRRFPAPITDEIDNNADNCRFQI